MATGAPDFSGAFSPGYEKYQLAKSLVDKYNKGNYSWIKDDDKEMIASIAAQHKLDFKAPSKPIRKALFDFADMATFGLLPNEWRPTSIGEEYGFESGIDKFAGGIGSLGGLLNPYGGPRLLMKGAGKAGGGIRNWWNRSRGGGVSYEGASAGNKIALLNRGRDIPLLTQGAPRLGQGAPRLGQGAPRLSGRPNLLGM